MAAPNMSAVICAGCKHDIAPTALFCPNCGRPKQREQVPDALIGKVLGERFQIQALIGQGASGTIYRAEHTTLRRKVAIKVLHNELSRDDLAVERFRREATTVAEVDNEHIVEIHDFGRTPDGRLYLASELLEGETLDSVLARETTLSIERAADILIQLGEALMEAHAIGYVHRDLRPRNVYLAMRRGKANFVKLLDFGLAKLVESGDASAASTSLGMTFGDPRYMSPEAARGDRIDRRADIYQLGCVAYEMLTGAPPFSGNRVFDILTKQVTESPAPLPTKRPGTPLWMEAAVARMLAKDPENRFATTSRMVAALRLGLETGEVMEDEVARRKESIPPPSVSRVMQKLGIADEPAVPAPAPAPKQVVDKSTVMGHASLDAAPMPAPVATAPTPAMDSGPPKMPAPAAPAPAPVPVPVPVIEQPRQRTGTPRVVAVDPSQLPVSGSIEPTIEPTPAPAPVPAAPVVRAKPVTAPPKDEPGISQIWYDDGDNLGNADRARRTISPSTTDLYGDDDYAPRKKRWPLIAAALGSLGVVGVALALAMGGGSKSTATDGSGSGSAAAIVSPTAPAPAPATDVAPSTVIEQTPPATAAAAKPAPAAGATRVAPTPTVAPPSTPAIAATRPAPSVPAVTTGSSPQDLANVFKPATPPAPTVTPPATPPTTTVPTTTVTPPPGPPAPAVTPVVTPPAPSEGPKNVTNNPQDPYGDDKDVPQDASPAAKADALATLGQQQLGNNDTVSAAGSFKKALELDPKNANATIGMGEIALRQGLFGDAIAHLSKAARLAPRSAKVFTLLGEAYLNSGNTKDATASFKKALALEPDNARAKEGLAEATSRTAPTPDDATPAPPQPTPAPATPAPADPAPVAPAPIVPAS